MLFRLLSVVLSASLCFSFVPISAYAANFGASNSALEFSGQNETGKNPAVVTLEASESIGFVYIDADLLALGEEQNIAIGLVDDNATIDSASITLTKASDNEEFVHRASNVVGNAALFTMSFTDRSDADLYSVAALSYEIDGVKYQIGLPEGQQFVSALSFEVVTDSVKNAFSEESAGSWEVTALAISDSGELVVADSVAEAVLIADEEGVSDLDAGESIIDEEEMTKREAPNESSDSENLDSFTLSSLFEAEQAWAAVAESRESHLVVALDPGHGGDDPGASNQALVDSGVMTKLITEEDVNLKIAQYCKAELETYSGVTVYMTRQSDEYVGLQERVARAANVGADVFISLHCNASGVGANGAEVWVPNDSSYKFDEAHVAGDELGEEILDQLANLGLKDRGVKSKDSTDSVYPDGSAADYYSVIYGSRLQGIPGIIVEHAFIDGSTDAAKLADDAFLQKLGIADATGISSQYQLAKDAVASSNALVAVQACVSRLGWESVVYDQKVAGTEGKALGLEAFKVSLKNDAVENGGVRYRVYDGDSWKDWSKNGELAGSVGSGSTLQAAQIELIDGAEAKYDIYYRAHVANVGWLGWAKNGASAGSVGYGYNLEALEVAVVEKGASAPGSTLTPFKEKDTSFSCVNYRTHVQDHGWQGYVSDGEMSGTSGESKRLEAIEINANVEGLGIGYRTHVQDHGWQGYVSDGEMSGTSGESKRLEAIEIALTGEKAGMYDVYYRVHCQELGWMGWAKNGEPAGSEGYAYRLEGIEILLVEKGAEAPGSTDRPFTRATGDGDVNYRTHVQDYGWQGYVSDGEMSGTSGQSKRLEGINVNTTVDGLGVSYRTHVQDYGWQGYVSDGEMSGTSGESKRLEAIEIELTGEKAGMYDVYYRVHCQELGWMGWAKNGEPAGSAGYAYRLEGIEIVIVEKGGSDMPTSSKEAFVDKYAASIMGAPQANVAQMVRYYNSVRSDFPAEAYGSKGCSTIDEFCSILYEEAVAEGVRPEVLFCQAMKETGWLRFGGSVEASQCNFGGLGAVDASAEGAVFEDVRTGLRAQAQHLKAYASTDSLANTCVDPRFHLVTRGCASEITGLNGKWAVPGDGYGESILSMMRVLLDL